VYVDPIAYLSRAIETAFEAAVVPVAVLTGVALVVVAVTEVSAGLRRRRAGAPRNRGRASRAGPNEAAA
jgi:hypothetical protein